MTNLAFYAFPKKSDREQWGLKGPVRAFTEQFIFQYALAANPADQQPPGDQPSPPSRIEFDRNGMRVGGKQIPFTFDAAGRKMRVRVSRPENYMPNTGAGGSPFSIADRCPNFPDGGTATTYYDDCDRPVETEVRDYQGGLVMSAVRMYDQMGRVIEERLTTHDIGAYIPANIRSQIDPEEIKNLMKENNIGGDSSVQYSYDDHTMRAVTRGPEQESVTVTTYNEHGDPDVEVTMITSVETGSSYGETRYSYQYDQAGNWTKQIRESHSTPEGATTYKSTTLRTFEYF